MTSSSGILQRLAILVTASLVAVLSLAPTAVQAQTQTPFGLYLTGNPTPTIIPADCQFHPISVFSLAETIKHDFPEGQSATHLEFDLYICLPYGFELKDVGTMRFGPKNSADLTLMGSTPILPDWTSSISSNVQPVPGYGSHASQGVTGAGFTYPNAISGKINTIVIHLGGKNNANMVDSIIISNLQLAVLPYADVAPLSGLPNGVFYMKAIYKGGRPANSTEFIKGWADDTWYYYSMPSLQNPIYTRAGNGAVELKFSRQPADPNDYKHDFENSADNIKGPLGSGSPQVEFSDCAGYPMPPAVNTQVTITAADAVNTPSVYSNYGFWSTYSNLFLSYPVGQNVADLTNLFFSEPGTYTLKAVSSTNPPLTAYSNQFVVSPRLLTWTPKPTLSIVGYNLDGTAIGSLASPGVTVTNVHNTVVANIPVDIELVTYASENDGSILSGSVTTITTNTNGLALFSGLNINPLKYDPMSPNFVGDVIGLVKLNGSEDPRYSTVIAQLSDNSMPVELTTLTAACRNYTVTIRWSTATESNNFGFDIERSIDRETWDRIGFVAGAGTSNTPRSYSYENALTQEDMLNSTMSYRLKQIDRDGKTEYSPVVTVALGSSAKSVTLLQNYPNPFNPSTNISFSLAEAGKVTLTVFNELGMEVARLYDASDLDAGVHTTSFNASSLPSGLYSYRLQTATGTITKTMVVAK